MHRALQVLAAGLVVAVAISVLGIAYFSFVFGVADHTQFTLTAEHVPSEDLVSDATTEPAELSGREAAILRRVLANGSVRTVAESPDVGGTYVERDGAYFAVRVRDGPTVNRTRPVLSIQRVNQTDIDAVTSDDLPPADRRAFGAAHRAWLVRNTDRGSGDPPIEYVYETVPDANDSVFVPEQDVQYVTAENRTFRVTVTHRNVMLSTTEYRLEQIARNESAFRAALVRNVSGWLNESAARPLERAIENGTYVSRAEDFKQAARPVRPVARACGFADLAEFTYSREEQTRYIRYEGRYYRVTLSGYTTAA